MLQNNLFSFVPITLIFLAGKRISFSFIINWPLYYIIAPTILKVNGG